MFKLKLERVRKSDRVKHPTKLAFELQPKDYFIVPGTKGVLARVLTNDSRAMITKKGEKVWADIEYATEKSKKNHGVYEWNAEIKIPQPTHKARWPWLYEKVKKLEKWLEKKEPF